MKIIHCSVWGDIELSDLAVQVIDTYPFQRLHYIKQTGFAYKVFPTATSSRFEHSIGVYHVTRVFLNEMARKQPDVCPDERTQELLCIAGLVHDLGHGPFSHLFDEFISRTVGAVPWADHEHRSKVLFRWLVKTNDIALSDQEITFITDRIDDPPRDRWYDTLICNPHSSIDMDKMDYVVRDSLHFGMKFHADVTRLLRNARVVDNEVCFCDRVRDEVDLFFQVRERMHQSVYRHPKIKYFETHLLHHLQEKGGDVLGEIILAEDVEGFLEMTDAFLMNLVPRDRWVLVETRRAPALEGSAGGFRCAQWDRAKKNLRYYKRKDPHHSFLMPMG
jgi:HD superfamily phosphohydrolase